MQPFDSEQAVDFARGVSLFNARQWFDAHEVWEDLWRDDFGDRKRFLQGMIQAAVLLEHLRRGNPRGARSLHHTCPQKFEGLRCPTLGIDWRQLLADLSKIMTPVLSLPDEAFFPQRGDAATIEVSAVIDALLAAGAPTLSILDDTQTP